MASIIRNMDRFDAVSNGTALTTGVMTAASVFLGAGQTIHSITFVSGTTAAATPTAWGFAVYSADATPLLKGNSTNQTTTAWAANTVKTLALTTAYTPPKAGYYWFGVWMAAATVPTLLSANAMTAGLLNSSGVLGVDKPLAVTSGTALVAPPATIVTGGTNSLVVPLVIVQ